MSADPFQRIGNYVKNGDRAFQELLKSARRGHSRSFEQLYTKLNRRVHAYVRVRGAADPEGMVNEVFLAVFTRLGSFSGSEAQFNAWIFTIARNKLIDETRKRQRRIREVSVEHQSAGRVLERASANESVEDQAMNHIETEALAQRLHVLTEDQREAVVLRIVGDLSIEAIADVMGKGTGAVQATLRRALRTIARLDLTQAVQQ